MWGEGRAVEGGSLPPIAASIVFLWVVSGAGLGAGSGGGDGC